jgi:ribulose-phosphate 3-epimerase
MKISVTFLKYKNTIEETIKEIDNTDADYIHVDVMDGKFVDNTFLPLDKTYTLLNGVKKPLDVHLMVENPIPYINEYIKLNPKVITVHSEININIDELIDYIHSNNIMSGIAINPSTSVDKISKYLNKVDHIIIMGVNPGYGGQKLIPETLNKIDELIELRNNNNYKYTITIDGGVNASTRPLLNNLDILTVGSYVSMSDNLQESINNLR